MNNHTIHGRLVRDPELTPRKNSDSSDRVNFTVATDRRYGDEADFFDCVCFGKRAEVIEKYFKKGQEIIVWGEGQIHSYEGKDGIKRKSYSVFVEGFDFCGSKNDSGKSKKDPGDNWTKQQEDIPF
jgi:single-strand DNA-binding protein